MINVLKKDTLVGMVDIVPVMYNKKPVVLREVPKEQNANVTIKCYACDATMSETPHRAIIRCFRCKRDDCLAVLNEEA